MKTLGEELDRRLRGAVDGLTGHRQKSPMLDRFTMWPSGRASRIGRNALVMWSVPHQLTANTRSIAAS